MFEFNFFPQAIALLHRGVGRGVNTAAEALAQAAQDNAPVESGFLESTIYIITTEQDTYGQGVGSPSGDGYLLPEVDERPESDTEAIVAVGANYGADVELGTRYMAPEPFLSPASEGVGNTLEDYFAGVEDFIAGLLP